MELEKKDINYYKKKFLQEKEKNGILLVKEKNQDIEIEIEILDKLANGVGHVKRILVDSLERDIFDDKKKVSKLKSNIGIKIKKMEP